MCPKKIAFLTDSCVDVSPGLLARHHVYTIPLRILCQDGEYLDGVNINSAEIYRRLHAGELPRTSLPRTEDMENVLRRIWEDGYDSLIAIMLSSGLSGTYNLARLAAEAVAEECGDAFQMRGYDSLSGSLGQAMILLQAADDLEHGMDWDTLTRERIPFLIAHTYAFFSVDTLENLRRGGRIGKITAAAGTLLKIKPILTFASDGQLTSVIRARGRGQVPEKLVDMTIKRCGACRKYNLAVANGADPEGMETVRARLTAALPEYTHLWDGEIDGTLSVYIGDGILGAAVQTLE